MTSQIVLTQEPILEEVLIAGRRLPPVVGAVVCFTGVVRGMEGEQPIAALEYEAFERMARHQFELILQEVERRWPVESIRLVHRVGVVPVQEPSLWVEVMAAHRGEAFAACQHLIEEMKRLVPIWKKPVAFSGR